MLLINNTKGEIEGCKKTIRKSTLQV